MPTAYFLINVAISHETEVIEKIKNILGKNSIKFEVQEVYGIYDIVVKIIAESDDHLRQIILEKLRPIDKIQSAITMMVV